MDVEVGETKLLVTALQALIRSSTRLEADGPPEWLRNRILIIVLDVDLRSLQPASGTAQTGGEHSDRHLSKYSLCFIRKEGTGMALRTYTVTVDGTIPVQALIYDDERILATQDDVGIYDG